MEKLDKIILAETSKDYRIVFGNTYMELNKGEGIRLLKSYVQGIYVGCYSSGNLLDLKNLIQNGPLANSRWSFIGKPLSNKMFQNLCDSFLDKEDKEFY